MPDDQKQESSQDQLLREIREDYMSFRDYWRENHEEAKTDLRFAAGDPWEPEDRQNREENHRPVICPDELGQYTNATINNLRQNERGIKVNPAGEGAADKDAERREDIIRSIEYKSNAQAAYTNAYENAINCGMGFFRLCTKVVGKEDDQEPRIRVIENPLSVLLDPHAKEPDYSDQKRCFVIDIMRKSDFQRNYPKAKSKDFSPEDMNTAPNWFQTSDTVVVAEYWRVDGYDKDGAGGKVTQYITNGVEILDRREWLGSKIPVIPVLGKLTYVPRGGKMERMYYSMIRKARGPQMMLAFIGSAEAEEFGMSPKAPFVGAKGQFDTDKDAWATVNKVPRAFIQYDAVVDALNSPLPPPARPQFTPNAQAYEVAFERWRRSVQAAMGIMPLPTAAQNQSEKSGIALERIQTQQSIGAYHFTDNFNKALENAGRQLDELITKLMDTERQIAVRRQDESHGLIHVVPGGQPSQQLPEDAEVLDPTQGEFDVTISTGPSYQSQRDAASEFADLLVQQMEVLPILPPQKAKLLAMSIKMKDLGPIGEEMAEIIDPPDQGAQQQMAQLQQQMAQMQQQSADMQGMLQKLMLERQGKVIEGQFKQSIVKMQEDTKLAVAQMNASKDANESFADREIQTYEMMHDAAHDVAMQAQEHQHEKGMAQAQAAHDAAMGAASAGQESAMADKQAGHQSALASQQAGHQSAQSAQDAAQSQAAAEAQPQE